MSKRNRRGIEVSSEEVYFLESMPQDLKEGTIPSLRISSIINIEKELEMLNEHKQRLINLNPGPITQWPPIEQDKWYALISEYEQLISLGDIRRLNPDLCQ